MWPRHTIRRCWGIGKAVEHLVAVLPPKERASILLKDVFDYSLEEIADLTDSTVGAVKAALKPSPNKAGGDFPSGEAGSTRKP